MDPLVIGLVGIGTLFFLLVVGVHVALALTVSGFVGILLMIGSFGTAMEIAVGVFYHRVTLPTLVTLPLFILMGFLASGGGISQDIYDSLRMWLGKLKSSLGIATVFACTAFGTVCGSSLVTAAVFSKISAPEMRRAGYDKKLAYGICASAGSIGMLIPPSILAVVYGILSGESIGKLLMAGVAPGLLLTFGFSIAIAIICERRPSIKLSEGPIATWSDKMRTLKDWWSVVIVATIIFGGLYGGIFSPSEAAAVSVFLLLLAYLGVTFFRKDRRKTIKKELASMFYDTAVTSAMIFLINGSAAVFSNFITMTGITDQLSNLLMGSGLSHFMIVIMLVLLMFLLGCFVDGVSILCITIPVFNPIINALGIDPIWYATVIILSVEVGLVTPPFGLNVFGTKAVAESDVSLEDIFAGSLPFLIVMLCTVALLLAVPRISTYLPSFVG